MGSRAKDFVVEGKSSLRSTKSRILGAVITSGLPGVPHRIEYARRGSLNGATLRRGTVRNRGNDLLRFGSEVSWYEGAI